MKLYGMTVASEEIGRNEKDFAGNEYDCKASTELFLNKEDAIKSAIEVLEFQFEVGEEYEFDGRNLFGEVVDYKNNSFNDLKGKLLKGENASVEFGSYDVNIYFFTREMPELVLSKEKNVDIDSSALDCDGIKTKSELKEFIYNSFNENRTDDYEIRIRGDANDPHNSDFVAVKKGLNGWINIASVEEEWEGFQTNVVNGPLDQQAYLKGLRNRFDTIIKNQEIMGAQKELGKGMSIPVPTGIEL